MSLTNGECKVDNFTSHSENKSGKVVLLYINHRLSRRAGTVTSAQLTYNDMLNHQNINHLSAW